MKASEPVRLESPKELKLGDYIPLVYREARTYRGITWHLTCFAARNDREDWVADLPGVSVNVSRYREQIGWNIHTGDKTWEEEADTNLASALFCATRMIVDIKQRMAILEKTAGILAQALEAKP